MNSLNSKNATRIFFLILLVAALFRSYGLTDHWRTNDHYNFGGVSTHQWLRCLKTLPSEYTWGRLSNGCDPGQTPRIYGNHSPAYLWGIWALTEVFGEHEWVIRSWMMLFSLLNICLVFLIARKVWSKEPLFWVLAVFFQSFFLSSLYFGTHPDNVSELTLTPMLLSAYFSLNRKFVPAIFCIAVAGFTDWIGYFQFTPLLLWAWAFWDKERAHAKTILRGLVLCIGFCYLQAVYLLGELNVFGFMYERVMNPVHVQYSSPWLGLLHPFAFIRNFFKSHARLLGPLFATLGFYEVVFGKSKEIWTLSRLKLQNLSLESWAIVFVGFGGLSYLVPGSKYAMVHIYNYVFLMGFWSLLCARICLRIVQSFPASLRLEFPKGMLVLGLVFIASYPYGIYHTNLVHDVANSVVFIVSTLIFLFWLLKQQLTLQKLSVLLIVGALANWSQMINYRNEPDSEYTFCEWAKSEYARTGKMIVTKENRTRTKADLYCLGVPIRYGNDPIQ